MKTIKARTLFDRPVTESRLDEAIERGELRRRSGLQATAVAFLDPCLAVSFEDGSGVLLPVKNYSEFDGFEAEDFTRLKVGYSGTALCHEGSACIHCRDDIGVSAIDGHGDFDSRVTQWPSKQFGQG